MDATDATDGTRGAPKGALVAVAIAAAAAILFLAVTYVHIDLDGARGPSRGGGDGGSSEGNLTDLFWLEVDSISQGSLTLRLGDEDVAFALTPLYNDSSARYYSGQDMSGRADLSLRYEAGLIHAVVKMDDGRRWTVEPFMEDVSWSKWYVTRLYENG